jgi:3-isopropylmalate dehydrogenase
MYGDILSDEAAELSGSLGLAGSINAGASHCMAQAQHGSAPDIAGQDKANPVSLILSVGMLLDWLGRRHGNPAFTRAAAVIEPAVDALIAIPATRTVDLGGSLGTAAFAEALCAEIGRRASG